MQGRFGWQKRQVDTETARYRSRASRVYFLEMWVVPWCEARETSWNQRRKQRRVEGKQGKWTGKDEGISGRHFETEMI